MSKILGLILGLFLIIVVSPLRLQHEDDETSTFKEGALKSTNLIGIGGVVTKFCPFGYITLPNGERKCRPLPLRCPPGTIPVGGKCKPILIIPK